MIPRKICLDSFDLAFERKGYKSADLLGKDKYGDASIIMTAAEFECNHELILNYYISINNGLSKSTTTFYKETNLLSVYLA